MHGGLAFKPAKKLVFDRIGYVKIQETEVYSWMETRNYHHTLSMQGRDISALGIHGPGMLFERPIHCALQMGSQLSQLW